MKVWELSKKILGIGLVAMPLAFTGCLTDEGDGDGDGDDNPPETVDSTTVKTGTLGAQSNNSIGSFLEADSWVIYRQAQVTDALQSDIDLVVAYSETQSTASIYSPKAAADGIAGSSGFTFAKNALGDNARTTEMRNISSAVFDGIKTKPGLDSAWSAAASSEVANGRFAATVGSALIIKTSKDIPVAIKVTALNNAADGTVSVEGKAKW